MELCALSDTLILDEDGLYDCNDFNDRLILGMKGTISEVELHYIRARLRGGILNKARRGELVSPLPVGLVYDEAGVSSLILMCKCKLPSACCLQHISAPAQLAPR